MPGNSVHQRVFDQLVCLVGENPMPVYLGIQQFAASGALVVLVCSKDTRKVAERLKDVLTKQRPDIRFAENLEVLANPYDPNVVRKHLEDLAAKYPAAALNYTGGTKVMSSFSVLPWLIRAQNGSEQLKEKKDAGTFYLEEEGGKFHFTDRGKPIDLAAEYNLDISVLRQLHDIEDRKSGSRRSVSVEELKAIFAQQTTSPVLLEQNPAGYPVSAEWISTLRENMQPLHACLSPETRAEWEHQFEVEGKSKSAYERSELFKQIKFFRGDWFELLIEDILRRITPDWSLTLSEAYPDATLLSQDKIASGQNFTAQGQQFEVDVIVSYNHRFFLFSMTTDPNKDRCQSKMFEAYYRARQMGGSLARSAVVCLADEDVETKCFLSLGENPRNQIFGAKTVQDWIDGDANALNRLKSFMERE